MLHLLVTYSVFILVGALVLWFAWHIRKDATANPLDLITSPLNGKLSATKIGQVVGLIVSTWIMVTLTVRNSLSAELLGIYLLYVGASDGYGKFLRSKANQPARTTTTTKTTKETEPLPKPPKEDPE